MTRHPAQVRTLVVHEPPLVELLPDAAALGAPLAGFPGDHGGFLDPAMGMGGEPEAFARVLRRTLEAR